jgi:hypothetical protein
MQIWSKIALHAFVSSTFEELKEELNISSSAGSGGPEKRSCHLLDLRRITILPSPTSGCDGL